MMIPSFNEAAAIERGKMPQARVIMSAGQILLQ
jgi:hypothetical protein